MAVCPFATYRPMPYMSRLPRREQSATMIAHTNGGGANLYPWFSRPGNTICSHFQIFWDGRIEQYLDTDYQGYAQYSGNRFAVSHETQDDGNPMRPWTSAQTNSLVRLGQWQGVPGRLSPDGPGGGVGYHSLYGDWNRSNHPCPVSVRIGQLRHDVIPRLGGPVPPPGPVPAPSSDPTHPPYGIPSNPHTVKLGDRNDYVGVMQHALQFHGAPYLVSDNDFGPNTDKVLRGFQQAAFGKNDGICGPQTWDRLRRV